MNQKKENNTELYFTKFRWILPVALWIVLSFCSSSFLLKVEERSYFEFDLFWLLDFLKKPSGILSYFGLFFTQFLHIPWLGALLWVMLLVASAELTRIVLRIPLKLSALTYIPASIFVAYNMSMGYIVYVMNHPGYFFSPVLGYLWILFTVLVVTKVRKPLPSLAVTAIWGLAGYYLAGFYGLVGILAAGIETVVSDRPRTARFLSLSGALIITLLAPILFLGTTTYYLPTGWTIGLPDHVLNVSVLRMQFPVILAVLFIPCISLLRLLKTMPKKGFFYVQCISLAAIIAIPALSWYRDINFKAELQMIHATDNLEWDKVTKIMEKLSDSSDDDPTWQPTRVMVVLNDLALIKTGREGQEGFAFEDGCKEQKRNFKVSMSLQIGWILGLHYGIPGLCQRWCNEDNMMFDWNNVLFKYNTMIAMLFDNTQLTDKYLSKLERTLFYRKWAKEQRRLSQDRDLMSKTAPYDLIIPLMCYDDYITLDQNGCENFLLSHFNRPTPENSTPLYDRVSLFFAMKSKDEDLFWNKFFLYLDSNNPQKIDRFYQEATYLFANLDQKEMLGVLPYDDQVKDLYKSFSVNATKNGIRELDEAKKLFTAQLRHTYYYYFYYVTNLISF